MATYAIGDIQGCFDSFYALLQRIGFREKRDRLWLLGDMVNRGPRSLSVLRWVRERNRSVKCILGNHDLHLIACALGAAEPRAQDTFQDVLKAKDGRSLVNWLRKQPLMLEEDDIVAVHGGFHPSWSLKEARKLARAAEKRLAADTTGEFADRARRPKSAAWDSELKGTDRAVAAAAVMVRIRCVEKDGTLSDHSGEPEDAPRGAKPWFRRFDAQHSEVFFGHWSALGFHHEDGYWCLDSGCVWGRELTAVRLEDGKVFRQKAVE